MLYLFIYIHDIHDIHTYMTYIHVYLLNFNFIFKKILRKKINIFMYSCTFMYMCVHTYMYMYLEDIWMCIHFIILFYLHLSTIYMHIISRSSRTNVYYCVILVTFIKTT